MLNGYIIRYEPGHQSAMTCANWKGWVYEHIYVAEAILGRKLLPGEEVHHFDFDRLNNIPSNLGVMSKRTHSLLHVWLRNGAPRHKDAKAKEEHVKKSNSDQRPQRIKQLNCRACGNLILRDGLQYCSLRCVPRKSKTNITKDLLAKLVWQKPLRYIAADYSVSDKAVAKWCKKWEIELPPRGYWNSAIGMAILRKNSCDG